MVDVGSPRRAGLCGRLAVHRPWAAWLYDAGPGLDDLLADDVIQSVMRADGVDPSLVRRLVKTVARTRKDAGSGRLTAG